MVNLPLGVWIIVGFLPENVSSASSECGNEFGNDEKLSAITHAHKQCKQARSEF